MSLLVDIQKSFGTFRLHVAFEAEAGVLGLLGASGCGKSMTLRCIAGIEKPDSGKIVLDGKVLFDSAGKVNLPPQQRKVGYLFQNYALFPNMNVKKNILCGLRHIRGAAEKEWLFAEIMRVMQLEGLEKHYPSQLSGGQQQRVALARILVNKPHILMLDEPFSALDTHLRELLLLQTKSILQEYGGISLLVTHSRDEAYQLCHRIALMQDGRLLTVKPTKRLFADPETISGAMITGCKNIAAAHKTGEYEVDVPDWGVRLQTTQPVRETLCAVGIRGHYFSAESLENRFPIQISSRVEEPFEWNIQFRYLTQPVQTQDLWWRVSKEHTLQPEIPALGVAPGNVLLLYPEKEV